MRTIHQDLDDLDRMVDSDAPKDKIRSQIRLISREVAALEADYSGLAKNHLQSGSTHAQAMEEVAAAHEKVVADLNAENTDLVAQNEKLKTPRPQQTRLHRRQFK